MSETTKKPQEAELLEKLNEQVKQNQEGTQFPKKTQKKKMRADRPMTVDQYLKEVKLDRNLSDLVRSLYKTKVKSFADWEKETNALLKKKIW